MFKAPDGSRQLWQAFSTQQFTKEQIEAGLAHAGRFFEAMGCQVLGAQHVTTVATEVQ